MENEGKAYFGTIAKLCEKYGKPVVGIDPQKNWILYTKWPVGVLSGAYSIKKITKAVKDKKRSWRDYAKIALGLYLFYSIIPRQWAEFGFVRNNAIDAAAWNQAVTVNHAVD